MFRKPLLLLTALVLILFVCLQTKVGQLALAHAQPHLVKIASPKSKESDNAWKDFGIAAQDYVQQHRMESRFCFLVNMEAPSGTARFSVYDLAGDSVLTKGLVTHGRCNQWWLKDRKYSNKVGSGCTSQARYKVGTPYQGRFGLAYKLHGLDSSNSNAFKRYVVLHAHKCVPEKETASAICQSDGCPTVSAQFLQVLKNYIGKANKPVLLWIKG